MDAPSKIPIALHKKATNQPNMGTAEKAIIPPGIAGKILLRVLKSIKNMAPKTKCSEVKLKVEFTL